MKILLPILLLASMSTLASDVEFTWTQELVREDGTAAVAEDVSKFTVYKVPLNFAGGSVLDATIMLDDIPGTLTTATYSDIEQLNEKKVAFVMTVTDSDGLESDASLVQILNMAKLKAPGFNKPKLILRMNP